MGVDKTKKCQNLYPDFTIEADAMSLSALNERLLSYAKETENVKEAEAMDMENISDPNSLGYAAELAKERKAPYSEIKKALGLKMSYLASRIKEKGGA